MYEICVISEFSSAHNLRNYKGKCENVHGHNWKIEASVVSKKLGKQEMVIDFKELKKKLNLIIEDLDHKNLNDIGYFQKVNPTSENIAKYIYDRLKNQGIKVDAVKVWESETSSATYSET